MKVDTGSAVSPCISRPSAGSNRQSDANQKAASRSGALLSRRFNHTSDERPPLLKTKIESALIGTIVIRKQACSLSPLRLRCRQRLVALNDVRFRRQFGRFSAENKTIRFFSQRVHQRLRVCADYFQIQQRDV